MIITKELIMTILIVFGVGKYSEFNSPKYYEIVDNNGETYNVKIEKKSKYACPLHCEVDHYHKVLIVDELLEVNSESYNIMGFGSEEVYINSYAVSNIQEISIEDDKDPSKLKKFNIQTYLP